jgi:C4-type Zn-finger protein
MWPVSRMLAAASFSGKSGTNITMGPSCQVTGTMRMIAHPHDGRVIYASFLLRCRKCNARSNQFSPISHKKHETARAIAFGFFAPQMRT